jgi:inosose dehydratase
MHHCHETSTNRPSRRHFLQWAGLGAAASLTAGRALADEPSKDEKPEPSAAKPPAGRKYELGLASYTFYHFSLDEALAMTKRVGLKHICLKDAHLPMKCSPEQIAKVVAKVKAAGLDLYGGGVISMRKPADVDQAFEYAKAAGMRVIVAMPSLKMIPLLDDKVKKYDIRVAVHNHGPESKEYPTPEVAYGLVKDLDPRVGLCMDIGHTVRSGGDPSRAAEQYADRLFDIHAKDVTAATPKGSGCEAGRGVIDIPKLLRTLDKTGYSGFVSFEYEKDMHDPLPGLAESVGYYRGVMAAI